MMLLPPPDMQQLTPQYAVEPHHQYLADVSIPVAALVYCTTMSTTMVTRRRRMMRIMEAKDKGMAATMNEQRDGAVLGEIMWSGRGTNTTAS